MASRRFPAIGLGGCGAQSGAWIVCTRLGVTGSRTLTQAGVRVGAVFRRAPAARRRAAGDRPMLFANREEAPRAAVAACALASRAREYTALRPIAGLGRLDRGWRAKWRGVWWAS